MSFLIAVSTTTSFKNLPTIALSMQTLRPNFLASYPVVWLFVATVKSACALRFCMRQTSENVGFLWGLPACIIFCEFIFPIAALWMFFIYQINVLSILIYISWLADFNKSLFLQLTMTFIYILAFPYLFDGFSKITIECIIFIYTLLITFFSVSL